MNKKQQQLMARELRNAATPSERKLWQELRKRSIGGQRILRQVIVRYEEAMGRTGFFIVDFLCPEFLLIIELDGGVHKTQFDYDRARDTLLVDMGYKVLRFSNDEVFANINEVIRVILSHLVYPPPLPSREGVGGWVK